MSDVNANIGVNIDSSQALAELKNLQRQISEFNLSIAKSNEAAALAQKSLQRNLINSINSIGTFSAELRTVNTTAESFTKALEGNKLSMREYFRYAGATTKTFGQNFKSELDTISKVAEERVKTLQTQYIKLGRDANGAMKAIAVRPLVLDMDNLSTKTQIAAQKQALFNQLLKQGSTNLLNFGKNTQWAGRQLMVGFTLPLMAFGAAASKSFQQLETEVIKFKKVYGDLGTTTQETDKALKGIRDLADGYTKYGVEVSKTVGLASQAAAAGFKNADLIAQTDAATKLAILGQIDQQQALETTISLQNAFKISSTDLASTIDFLNAVENQTVTSLDDITTAIPKVAPVIQSLGGDVKDLAFFLTAMKEGGVNAAEGANALKSGLASLINPSKKANDMLASMGININNIVNKNQGNLKATVIEFAKELDRLDPLARARAIETMFGKFQFARISTLLSNVTQQGNQASRVLALAGESAANLASITSKELGVTAESSLVKFQAALAKLRASLAPVGEVFMRSLAPVIDFVSGILDKFNHLSEGTKKFIAITVGVIGGLGPIVLMTFGLLANGIANILKLFMTLRNGYQRLTGQSQNLGEQTQYLTNEQLDAAAAAHSLEQSHARLTQQFTAEAREVNLLRMAYQEALAAGASFANMNPGMMRTPKLPKFAGGTEGIMVRGPGTGTSDSILARVSNGEAIIPASSVAAHPDVVRGLVAGNLPGFKVGDPQVNIPGSYHSGHFGGTTEMSGLDLQDWAKSQSQSVQSVIDSLIGRTQNGLEHMFTVFDNRVVAISDELNLMVGKTGSGKSAPVSLIRRDLLDRANVAHPELVDQIMKAGGSLDDAKAAVQKVTTEIELGLNKLGGAATATAEDIDKITTKAYETVAKDNKLVEQAYANMQNPTAVADYSIRAKGNRLPIGKSYKTKKEKYADIMSSLTGGNSVYSPAGSFKINDAMSEEIGASKKEIQLVFKSLSDEAKLRLANLRGDIKNFAAAFEEEALNAGINIGKAATTGVAKGAQTASPSRATIKTGNDIDNGLKIGMSQGEGAVVAQGNKVGAEAVIAIEKGAKKRRASFRPQGPAGVAAGLPDIGSVIAAEQLSGIMSAVEKGSIAAGLSEGFVPTSGISEKMIGPLTKNQTRIAKLKSALKPKFGMSAGGMKTSAGLMVGSMALNALPEFTGKSLMQSSMNMAAMGAMFGPWGAAAGGAIGLVTAGISSLIKKEKEQQAMQEAVFKPSADLATYFGNAVVDADASVSHFNVTMGSTALSTNNLGKSFGFTTAELKAFTDLIASLPDNNPLKEMIVGLTNEKNTKNVEKSAKAFVTTQLAIGQIKPDQAQKTLDLMLSASGHAGMIGNVFIDVKNQTEAVSKTLRAAAGNTKVFGNTLVELAAAASNSTSLEQMNAIIQGIAASGLQGAAALDALQNAYLGLNNSLAAKGVQTLRTIKGMSDSNIIYVMSAVNAGLDLNLKTEKGVEKNKAWIMKQAKDFLNKKGTYGMQQANETKDPQVKALEKQNLTLADRIKILEKQKQLIDDKLKKEKAISDEFKRQNDYLSKQQDLDQKIAEAKMSGNYIEAANLQQEKMANTAQFNYDTKIGELQNQSDALGLKIADLRDKTETNTTAISNLTGSVNNLNLAITNWKPGSIISDSGSKTSPIPISPGISFDIGNGSENLGSAGSQWYGFGKWSDRQLIKKYSESMGYKPGTYFYTQTGNQKDKTIRYDEFVVLPDGNIERVKAGLKTPPKLATGGQVQHYEPGGTVSGPGTATSDSIPAMLSDGEYVVKASAVDKYGVPLLHAINSQKFATGGYVNKFSEGGDTNDSMSLKNLPKNIFTPKIDNGIDSNIGNNWGKTFNNNIPIDKSAKRDTRQYLIPENVPGYQDTAGPSKGLRWRSSNDRGMTKKILNSETASLYLDGKKFANGGYIQKFKDGIPAFGLGGLLAGWAKKVPRIAASAAIWQSMEEIEKVLSLKYGANENASGIEKWGKGFARLGWSALQGGLSGTMFGPEGFPAGAVAGTLEGLIGLIKDGSQFGVKGGAKSGEKGFNAKKELASMSLGKSIKEVAKTAVITPVLGPAMNMIPKGIKNAIVSKLGQKIVTSGLLAMAPFSPHMGFSTPVKPRTSISQIMGGSKPASILESKVSSAINGNTINNSIENQMQSVRDAGSVSEGIVHDMFASAIKVAQGNGFAAPNFMGNSMETRPGVAEFAMLEQLDRYKDDITNWPWETTAPSKSPIVSVPTITNKLSLRQKKMIAFLAGKDSGFASAPPVTNDELISGYNWYYKKYGNDAKDWDLFKTQKLASVGLKDPAYNKLLGYTQDTRAFTESKEGIRLSTGKDEPGYSYKFTVGPRKQSDKFDKIYGTNNSQFRETPLLDDTDLGQALRIKFKKVYEEMIRSGYLRRAWYDPKGVRHEDKALAPLPDQYYAMGDSVHGSWSVRGKALTDYEFYRAVAGTLHGANTSSKEASRMYERGMQQNYLDRPDNFTQAVNEIYAEQHGIKPGERLRFWKYDLYGSQLKNDEGLPVAAGYYSLDKGMAYSYARGRGNTPSQADLDSGSMSVFQGSGPELAKTRGAYYIDLLPHEIPQVLGIGGMTDEMAIVVGERLAKKRSVFTGMAKSSEYQYEVDPGAIRGLSPWKIYAPGKPWTVDTEGTFGVPGEVSAQMAELLNSGKFKLSSGNRTDWDEESVRNLLRQGASYIEKDGNSRFLPQSAIPQYWGDRSNGTQEILTRLLRAQEMYNLIRKNIQHLPEVEFIKTLSKPLPKIPGMFNGGQVSVPKFHSWNGPIPGPYGQELSAVLKSGTEGVYQEDYMSRLRRDADINTSTSNSNAVYNIDMTINGGGANANEIANQVMAKIKTISNQNNKSNKVVF